MKWISVKDKLPKEDMRVIIWNEMWPASFLFATYNFVACEFMKDIYTHEIQFPVAPTHWMPLIQPFDEETS